MKISNFKKLVFGFAIALILNVQTVFANGLNVTNLNWDQAAQTVTFDLQWNNSWRVTGAPDNWDAAWVFVKFRPCGSTSTTDWTHGIISTTVTDHSFGNLEPTFSDGSGVGIDAAPNNTGVMLRRNSTGIFSSAAASSVTLNITNLPTTGDYDVKVMGIEMVFVPSGDYLLGSTLYNDYSSYTFSQTGNSNPYTPYTITSENTITLNSTNQSNVSVAANFPKGFDAFYMMKYEITQGQYAEFLNTISSTMATNRFLGNFNSYRNRLTNTGTYPNVYYSDKPDRAQNYLSWQDLTAYLDWACLRPMTEMEFEKACRGQGPVIGNEYAWGSLNITNATTINTTPENGTEESINAGSNACYGNTTFIGGDGGRGPLRAGIFAKSTSTTREQTGATYFGIMEMSGNVWERAVSIVVSAYEGGWGNGNLDASGLADVATWPLTGNGLSFKGGSWYDATTRLRVSDRTNYNSSAATNRTNTYGGRGVR